MFWKVFHMSVKFRKLMLDFAKLRLQFLSFVEMSRKKMVKADLGRTGSRREWSFVFGFSFVCSCWPAANAY